MGEYMRQIWHASMGFLIGIIVYYWNIRVTQALFISMLFGLFFVRILVARNYEIPIINDYLKVLSSKERKKKIREMGDGGMFFVLGALISTLFFPKEIAAISIIVLGISDALATMVGINSEHYIYGKKTLEGSIAFFTSCFVIITITHNFIIALIISIFLTPMELLAGFDDNVTIPPTCSLLLVLLRNIIVV